MRPARYHEEFCGGAWPRLTLINRSLCLIPTTLPTSPMRIRSGRPPTRCAGRSTPPSTSTSCWACFFLKYISDSFEARREELKAELEKDGIGGPAARTAAGKSRRVHRRAGLLGAAGGALAEPAEPGHAARHRHAHRRRHPRRRARQPEAQGQAAARLRPPRHRAGEAQGADRPDRRHRLQGRPRQGARHARPRLRILPRQVRRRPRASSAASSSRRAASSGCWSRCSNPTRAASTTRAAARAACSCSPNSSSKPTAGSGPTSRSSARSRTRRPGGWRT